MHYNREVAELLHLRSTWLAAWAKRNTGSAVIFNEVTWDKAMEAFVREYPIAAGKIAEVSNA